MGAYADLWLQEADDVASGFQGSRSMHVINFGRK
jgi:hypothetical protein